MARLEVISHWRDSGRNPRFFFMDARSAFPLLLFLVHIKMWTFIVALIITIFFGILDRYGFSLVVFGRTLRTVFAGRVKLSRPWWRKKRLY